VLLKLKGRGEIGEWVSSQEDMDLEAPLSHTVLKDLLQRFKQLWTDCGLRNGSDPGGPWNPWRPSVRGRAPEQHL